MSFFLAYPQLYQVCYTDNIMPMYFILQISLKTNNKNQQKQPKATKQKHLTQSNLNIF